MFERFEYSTKVFIKEAQKAGIVVTEMYPGQLLSLKLGSKVVFMHRQMASITTSVASAICKDKEVTKKLLNDTGLETARGKTLSNGTSFREALEIFQELGSNVALKPLTGSKGVGVYLNIKNDADLESAWAAVTKENDAIIIEKMVSGLEFRFFTTPEKVVAVTLRDPANVIGNGKNNIAELVEAKNLGRGGEGENIASLFKIVIDDEAIAILNKQHVHLDHVPKDGEKIYLREISNLSAGGDSIDMTDDMPQRYKNIAIEAVRAIPGLAYAGVDIIIDDINSVSSNNYAVLEVNSSPGLGFHHMPYKGKERNVSLEILKICFPGAL